MITERRVAFDHFWSGFDPHGFHLPVLTRALGVAPVPGRGDITVTSVFWTRREKAVLLARRRAQTRPGPPADARYRIWHTGENLRPPWRDFDLTLSFDVDDYDGRNLYLPLALTALGWNLGTPPGRHTSARLTPDQAAAPRRPSAPGRPKFACAFLGNPEPRRLHAIEALSRYLPVDVFGTLVGRPVADKQEVAADYRFVVCFENDLYPGYVTEKPVDAYASGAIPLWSGIDAAGMLHPDALVNQADFPTMRSWVEHVADLDRSETDLSSMAARPLFRETPTLDPLINRLRADLREP